MDRFKDRQKEKKKCSFIKLGRWIVKRIDRRREIYVFDKNGKMDR